MADIITDIDSKTKDRKSFLELQARVLLLEHTIEQYDNAINELGKRLAEIVQRGCGES